MNSFFKYNNSQKNGTIILLILLCMVLTIRIFLVPILFKTNAIDIPNKIVVLKPKADQNPKTDEQTNSYSDLLRDKSDNEGKLFPFNPNKLSEEKWIELGLSKKQIKIIFNFESKGGTFRKKEDLAKIYGISKNEYIRLEPYISIPELAKTEYNDKKPYPTKSVQIVELNSADSLSLINIKGIGPYTANKILKYRRRLGGFYKKEQLFEIWGLDSNLIAPIIPLLTVNSSSLIKSNLNTISYDSLAKHPYIEKYTANKLIKIRKTSGKFVNLKNLVELKIIKENDLNKIGYYFEVK